MVILETYDCTTPISPSLDTPLPLTYSNIQPQIMKKLKQFYFLLLLLALFASCNKRAPKDSYILQPDRICDASDGKECFALDNKHAVAISIKDGKPKLTAIPADSMGIEYKEGLSSLTKAIIHNGSGHRFNPQDTRLRLENNQLVFETIQGEAQFMVEIMDQANELMLILNDGVGLLMTTMTPSTSIQTLCKQPKEITSQIYSGADGECVHVSVTDKICLYNGIGIAEILDNAIDPFEFVRVSFNEQFIRELLNGTGDNLFRNGGRIEIGRDGFRKPNMILPQAMGNHTPMLLVGDQTIPPVSSGGDCFTIDFVPGEELGRFNIARKKVYFCNQALYLESEGQMVFLLSLANSGTDLCFTIDGECLVIKTTNLNTAPVNLNIQALEPCEN
jgi:hypothetical protein